MLPLVAPFGRWPAETITVRTLLDDPDRPKASAWPRMPDAYADIPGRCRRCHRSAEHLSREGLGSTCARRDRPDRAHLARRPRMTGQDGPDLIDVLAEGRPAAEPAIAN